MQALWIGMIDMVTNEIGMKVTANSPADPEPILSIRWAVSEAN